jgi:hypothetical protein
MQMQALSVSEFDEYARRCGHADFLHERIDGRVGILPAQRAPDSF